MNVFVSLVEKLHQPKHGVKQTQREERSKKRGPLSLTEADVFNEDHADE